MVTRRREGNDPLRPIVETGRDWVGLVPGTTGNVLGAGFEYAGAGYEADDRRQAFTDAGMSERELRRGSRAARRAIENLDNLRSNTLLKYGVLIAASVAGGWLGAMVGGAVLPFAGMWIGGLAGTAIAGYAANRIYEGAMERSEQDVVTLVSRSYSQIRNGREPMTREIAFATLMAALPEREQARYEHILQERAGTTNFARALETREGQQALARMARDPRVEELLRSYVHIPPNPQQPYQHVADQYAELVNSGELDARAIVLNPQSIRGIATRHYMQLAVQERAGGAPEHDEVLAQQLPPGADRTQGRRT